MYYKKRITKNTAKEMKFPKKVQIVKQLENKHKVQVQKYCTTYKLT